jgi:hypothetical protein
VSATAAETEDDFGEPPKGTASRWKAEIEAHDKERERWRDRVERIEARYRDERNREDTERRFALLWANLEVLQPTLYARDPKPEVARRFQDRDPVGRVMATIVERNLAVAIERGGGAFGRTMRAASKTSCWAARASPGCATRSSSATTWTRARASRRWTTRRVPGLRALARLRLHRGARVWDEVTAVWRRSFLDREELIERFGDDIGKRVPLDNTSPGRDGDEDAGRGHLRQGDVYEIWDKDERQTLWVHKGMDEPLDSKPYPEWMLADFPCPPPLFGTLTNGTLTPVPDYVQYQDQAQELDDLTGRIAALTSALRLAGFVPGRHGAGGAAGARPRRRGAGHSGQVWAAFGGQKLADLIVWLPIQETVATLTALQQCARRSSQDAYEITGLSDILRGSTQASETATAQQIKAQWGSIRVRTRQQDVQRFAADLLERMARRWWRCSPRSGWPSRRTSRACRRRPAIRRSGAAAAEGRRGADGVSGGRRDGQHHRAGPAGREGVVDGVARGRGAVPAGVRADPAGHSRQRRRRRCRRGRRWAAELLLGAVRRFRAGPAMESSIEAAFEALGAAAAQAAQQQGPPPMSPVEMAKHQIEASKVQVAQQKVQVDAAEGRRPSSSGRRRTWRTR